MGNKTTGNIITVDTTDTTLWSGTKFVREIQWLGDADNLADTSAMVITSAGGGDITVSLIDISVYPNPFVWRLGPFNPGIPMQDVGVTIDNGLVVFVIE